jgi:hypothetical protein
MSLSNNVIKSKEFENSIVTMQSLGEMFKLHHKQMDALIRERLKALQTPSAPTETVTPTPAVNEEALEFAPGMIDNDEEATTRPIVYCTYSHSGRFWHMPKTFALPLRMKLGTGWKIWCHGIPCYQITGNEVGQLAIIRPFRHFKNKMLPKHIRHSLSLHWRPNFEVMEACHWLDPADEDSFKPGMVGVSEEPSQVCFKKKESKSNAVGAINVVQARMAME